jgi:hypothetical protein
MDISADKKELITLLKQSQKGEIVLPQFQRNFVWPRDDIRDLLVSITKGYFVGSFLLIRVDKDNLPFQPRPIAGVDLRIDELKPEWMILDGQQRMTSLHYVFTAPPINLKGTKYPYRFYLDLKKVEKGNVDEAIWSERYDYCDEYEEEQYQFENQIIPFTRMLNWEDWCSRYMQWLIDNGQSASLTDFIKDRKPVWDRWIKNIREKMIPTIEIPKVKSDDEESIGEVCAIFEKINSTGVPLSVYDLLTARLYKYGIDLHELWQEAITDYDLLNSISDGEPDSYGVFVLRVISLMRGLDAKSKTLVSLKHKNFVEDWRTAALYFNKALQRITSSSHDGFGAFSFKWMPYSTMIPVLAALLWDIEKNKRDHRAYDLIKKWYWSSVFLERYGGAVESTTYRDYTDLTMAFKDVYFVPEVLVEAENQIVKNPEYRLRGINRVNSIYKGIINLIALQGARDFIKYDSIQFHELDDHHIFPQAYLKRIKAQDETVRYDNNAINTIINKTLISSETNRRISKLPPSKYIAKLIPSELKGNIMRGHFVYDSSLEKLENDDYDGFLTEREKILVEKVKDCIRIG